MADAFGLALNENKLSVSIAMVALRFASLT
jgi:hypothetical protein